MAGNFDDGGKKAARARWEQVRRSLTAAEVVKKGDEANNRLVALPFFPAAKVVAAYVAQPFELAPRLEFPGKLVVLPRVDRDSRVLSFHRLSALVRGRFGLMEPAASDPPVPPEEIDVWIVPGVAFTRTGERLGRGGGFYDATLALRRPGSATVGFCFDACVAESLPTEPHDVRVDWLVTDSRAISTV